MAAGRIFDGKTSRAREVQVGLLGGGLRLEIEGDPPVFWAWSDLPRSCLTVTGDKVLVRRGLQTLEVADKGFYEDLRQAYPQASLFRSPFRTWIATPTRFAATLATAAASLALAFFVLVPWAGDLIASSLPAEVEAMAGQSLLAQVTAGQTVLEEPTAKLQEFWDQLELPGAQDTQVTLVDDGVTVNAFALMGGQVVVYQALVEKMESADELAGVLAHEAGHGTLRHSARLIGRSMAGAFLLSYLLSDPTGITGAVLGNVDTLRNLQFSREMEAEADAWAAQALEGKADVRALGVLLRRIEVIAVPSWATFLTNHPATGDRAASWNTAPGAAMASPELQRLFEEIQAGLTPE